MAAATLFFAASSFTYAAPARRCDHCCNVVKTRTLFHSKGSNWSVVQSVREHQCSRCRTTAAMSLKGKARCCRPLATRVKIAPDNDDRTTMTTGGTSFPPVVYQNVSKPPPALTCFRRGLL
jgi:hypothetical protein